MKILITVFVVVLIGLLLFTTGCKPKKTITTTASEEVKEEISKTTSCQPVLVDATYISENQSFRTVNIKDAKIEGNCVILNVQHSGGCPKEDDVYNLVWDKKMMKSYPPQLVLVPHVKGNDPCESMVDKELKFDLTPVQAANKRGEVILRFKNYEERLKYTFSPNQADQ